MLDGVVPAPLEDVQETENVAVGVGVGGLQRVADACLRPVRRPNGLIRAELASRSASPQEPTLCVLRGQLAYFVREALDLFRQEVVLLDFPPQEVERHGDLLLDALWREEIDVRRLVVVVPKVTDLDQALVHWAA